MVSQFGSLGYTIMGKTADLTVVQKTIIDTLHKEGKPQTCIAKEAGCSQSAVSKHVNRKLSGRKKCGRKRSSINNLQIVQITASRVLTRSRKYDHITPILQSLHWLPIKFRISYKILLLAYKALNDLAPAYLTNLLSRYNPTRSLRSQNSGLLVVPRIAKSTKGGRIFHIWLLNSGIAFLITFRVQTHSLCLNLD